MGNPVAMVRRMTSQREDGERYEWPQMFLWCPGCDALHCVRVPTDAGGEAPPDYPIAMWGWDGNLEAPTLSPSILVQGGPPDAPTRCHSFVIQGRWQFLGDSTHALADQWADMVPLPDWLVR